MSTIASVPPALSVIVLSLRKGELLERCLRSAQLALRQIERPTELVLILNETPAEEAPAWERFLAEKGAGDTRAEVVCEPENTGFTPAVDKGVRRTKGEWVGLLNDDATIETQAFAAMLAAGSSASDVGSVAAQMRFADRPGIINSAGIEVDRLGIAYDRLLGEPVSASETDVTEVFGACGGAAIYRRAMLNQIGGFDGSFFAYLEDVDVAWRARALGWRCLYEPSAVVLHRHSATLGHGSSQKYFLSGRNRIRVLAKNADSRLLRRYGGLMIANDLAYVVFLAAARRTLAPLRGRVSGLRDWRRYRAMGAASRGRVQLTPIRGVRAALRRHKAWG